MHKLVNKNKQFLGLIECFNGLKKNVHEYSRLMVNYTFYFIKNIMSYKLVCMINIEEHTTDAISDSVAGFKSRMDELSLDFADVVLAEIKPEAIKLLHDLSEDNARRFLDLIFSIVNKMLYKDIYTAFCVWAGLDMTDAKDENPEYKNFYRMYINAGMAYRPEAFEPWLTELESVAGSFKNELHCEMPHIVKLNLNEHDMHRNSYQLKKTISENVLMADELCVSLTNIKQFYEKNTEAMELCTDADIIKGIFDTVVIKLESIEESKAEYLESSVKKITGYRQGFPQMTNEEHSGLTDELYLEWLAFADEVADIADINKIFKKASNSDYLISYKDRLQKYTNQAREVLLKQDKEYKKDYLLYEVSTYGEIMSYSVPRLKESAEGPALEFAGVCEKAQNEILIIIQKNNITVINPAPHEMFNGKEHEVLIAETSEGFAKGEIIKIINPGYKRGDFILTRANVIAAK